MFVTVLRQLKSPQNVGMIVRTHVAMGGNELILLGHELPWQFKKGSQAFSRKLESQCQILHIRSDREFFAWSKARDVLPVAIEIAEHAEHPTTASWRERPALVFGNEGSGLPADFVADCPSTVRLPQFGAVGSLNVAIAHAMVVYELRRAQAGASPAGHKYPTDRD